MKEEKKLQYTIRGDRHYIELEKRYKGMPGFAPEYYDKIIGSVVFNFPHDEENVYFQSSDLNYDVLEKEDIINKIKYENN